MNHSLKFTVLVLIFISLIQSCRKDVDDFSNIVIEGEIELWNYGENREVNLCAYTDTALVLSGPITSYGSSSIDSDGNFKIGSLQKPTNDFLVPLESIFGNEIILSDNTANGLKGILLVFFNNGGALVGDLNQGNTCNYMSVESFYESYIYVDKDVTITGTGVHSYQIGFSTNTDTIKCNLELKAGWNNYIQKVISINGYFSITYEIYNQEPIGAIWCYQDFNYYK